MLNENAKKWVAALRSGEYKQAKGYLRTPKGFCCLGVACDLYAQSGGGQWKEREGFSWFQIAGDEIDNSGTKLLDAVKSWLGLASTDGRYQKENYPWGLVRDNDELKQKSFSEIADIIESEPEGLFVK